MLVTADGQPVVPAFGTFATCHKVLTEHSIIPCIQQMVLTWLGNCPRTAAAIRFLVQHRETEAIAMVSELFGNQRHDFIRFMDLVFQNALIADADTWIVPIWDRARDDIEYFRKTTYDELFTSLPHYRAGLINCLSDTLAAYESERKTYYRIWGEINESAPTIAIAWDSVATALMNAVNSVANERDVLQALARWEEVSKSYQDIDESEGGAGDLAYQLPQRIELQWAKQAIGIITTASKRTIDLFGLMAPITPSKRTVLFLQRVSRCYLLGLDPECVVMCRAALDAEFEAEISTDDCITVLGSRRPPHYVLDDRIAVALRLGRITQEASELAKDIKNAGNSAIHRDPSRVADAKETIRQCLEVLVQLSLGPDWRDGTDGDTQS